MLASIDATHVRGFEGDALAADPIYLEGPILAFLFLVVIFVFIARTGEDWYVGAGLCAVLVAAFFMVTSWASLADYPLSYREGDRPKTEAAETVYEKWALDPKDSVITTFDVGDASGAQTLFGTLAMEYGCPHAKVEWRIDVDDESVASGTFGEGQQRELAEVAVAAPNSVSLHATRKDSSECQTQMYWKNPGLEGPGNGEFRFISILPGQ